MNLTQTSSAAALELAATADRIEPSAAQAGVPLWRELKRRIAAAIAEGQWRPGEALPPEAQLAARFAVSIGTLRKAIGELVADSVLVRQQGRGTFVAVHDQRRQLFQFFHLVPRDGGPKVYPDVVLERFGRARATEAQAARLAIRPREALFEFRNLLSIRGQPVLVDDICVPQARFAQLTEQRLRERRDTIYRFYQDAFGISVVRIRERATAVLAPPDVAALLALPAGAPLLRIDRVAFTLDDRAVELRVSYVDTTHYEYAPTE